MPEEKPPQPHEPSHNPIREWPFHPGGHKMPEQLPKEFFDKTGLDEQVFEKDPLLDQLPGEDTGKGN